MILRVLGFHSALSLTDCFRLCRRPKVDLSPPGSGKDRTRDKTTPEGQVRVPFLGEAAAGKAMTLALDIGF